MDPNSFPKWSPVCSLSMERSSMNKPRNDLWKVQKHFSDGKVTVTPARRQSTTGTNNFTEDAPASRTQLLTISPGQSIHHSKWAALFYERQRSKGKSHTCAIRALAFKWIRIIFRCWESRKPYDETLYLRSIENSTKNLSKSFDGLPQILTNPTYHFAGEFAEVADDGTRRK